MSTTVYQLNHGDNKASSMSAVSIKSEPVYNVDDNSEGNRYESDNESNDSDPGRLQMDISSSQEVDGDGDMGDVGRSSSSPVKLIYKHNRSYNNNTQSIADSGRDTPESNKSDDHRTDPATTQLWQALARSTGNGANNQATQLLRQMITCRTLGLPIPSALNISSCGNVNAQMGDQPMALIKVGIAQHQSPIIFTIMYHFSFPHSQSGDASKTSSGRRKQSCPSKAAMENTIDGKSPGNNKKMAQNDKPDAKAWSSNVDAKVRSEFPLLSHIENGQILTPSSRFSSRFSRIQKRTTTVTKVQIRRICPAPIVAH